jgi:spore germination protein
VAPVALGLFVLAGFWGYREHAQKQALLIKAENQYQRAFHDLAYQVDQLHHELGKALVINSWQQRIPCLNHIWRLSYAAQADVGQLPMSLMPMHQTQEFLHRVGKFSFETAVRSNRQPLTADQWNTLQSLYRQSGQISASLQRVQAGVLNDGLRWTVAEAALNNPGKQDNQIVDGFRVMEEQVSHFPEGKWGPVSNKLQTRISIQTENLNGPVINPQTAARKTAEFLGARTTRGIVVQSNGRGAQYPSYTITANVPGVPRDTVHLGMTQKGGVVTWFMNHRPVGAQRIDMDQANRMSLQWLRAHGFRNMALLDADQYGNVAVLEYVYKQGDVYIYPDKVNTRVALDNGEIVGLVAKDYVFHHRTRSIPAPRLTPAEAKQRVSPRLAVKEQRLVLMENDRGQEVLAYEFLGTMDNATYRVYVNAQNGEEEGVERMR